jgi:anti-sigma regulatory factor (Ser/Thr protein kinase)
VYNQQLTLEPTAESVRLSRELVWRMLDDVDEKGAEIAAILTDEVVANAVEHGRPPIVLTVDGDREDVTVTVTDCGPSLPVLRAVEPMAERGRGMKIIDVLADAWGVDQLPVGKRVWFRLHVPHRGDGSTDRAGGGARGIGTAG